MHGAAYKHVPVSRPVPRREGRRSVRSGISTNKKGWTPLKIAEGVQRGMNIVSSPPTEAAIRQVMQ